MNGEEKIISLLEQINARQDRMESKLEKVDNRQDRTESLLDTLANGLGRLEQDVKELKSGQSKLEADVTALYDGYLASRENDDPLAIKSIEDKMVRLLRISGLNRKLTPHSLRHTHASLLAEAGVSLLEIMKLPKSSTNS